MNRYTPIGGAVLSGLCLFVAVQHAVFLLAWVALVPLLIPLFGQSALRPFRAGLIMGASFACCAFGWMIAGLPAFTGLAVGYGVALFLVCVVLFALGCAALLWVAFLLPHPLYLASVWALAEIILQWVAAPLPWFLFRMGNALSDNVYAIQPASVTGVTGISFIVVLVNGLFAKAIVHRSYKRLLLPVVLLVGYMCCGWWLLFLFERSIGNTASRPAFKLSILQQHIPPEIQWDQTNGNALVQQLLQQERLCIAQHPNLILWSESAIPWTYSPNDDLVQELLHYSDAANISHVLGMNTAVTNNEVRNSAYCLLPGGKLAGRYDKSTPLLFIERPWHGWLLPFFSANGYSVLPGHNNLPLPTPYGKAGILICNESALPASAAATATQGAEFLLNLSNDGWFRDTYLVSSHFYNARLRAVETRKDLAINSNNGWCGLVNAAGRITHADVVTIRPNTVQTIAVRYPLLPACICLCLVLFTVIINQKTKAT
jgi:apolipoprotein N-acyltransferase